MSETTEAKDPKSGEDPAGSGQPANTEPDWKAEAEKHAAEAEKWKTVAGTYKEENEKYRKKPEAKLPVTTNQPTETNLNDVDARFITNNTISKLKDAFDDKFQEPFKNFSPEQEERFQRLYPLMEKDLIDKAAKEGRVISQKEATAQLQTVFDIVSGGGQSTEDARLRGAAEANEARKGDIGSTTTIPKTDQGITEKDKEVEESTGGAVSAERAKEIRENRMRRAQEFAPRR